MPAPLRSPLPLILLAALSLAAGPLAGSAHSAPAQAAAAAAPPQGTAASLGQVFGRSTPDQIALAEHLRARGVVFYGAFWCQHCFHQKVLFGQEAGDRLPYVECAKDEAGARACQAAGVAVYPTWMMGAERRSGVQTLRELASWSGYQGPSDFPTARIRN